MNLNFKQAIFCYSLIHSVIITLASLTNPCLQAAIDASPAALLQKKKEEEVAAALLQKKLEEEAAAALLQKKKEEEAAAALLQKKQEEEAAAALLQKKKQEEAAAALLQKKKQEEDWLRLVNDNREDIDDMKSLLSRIGLSKGKSQKYAEVLVLKHKVDSVTKFQRKVGSDIAGYSATLQLDTDDAELLEEYFKRQMSVSTPPPPPLSSPGTTANSSVASAVGGASTKSTNHWTCFMVHSFPLDLVRASRLTCLSLT